MNKRKTGERNSRGRKHGSRMPLLVYYSIYTDTDNTERFYFEGLKQELPDSVREQIEIKVQKKVGTKELISSCLVDRAQGKQYRKQCIVFDHDQVAAFDQIIWEAKNNKILVGWSNPCIEIFFHAYFGYMPRYGTGEHDSQRCCEDFSEKLQKVTGRKYEKKSKNIFQDLKLCGDIENALAVAERRYEEQKKQYKLPSQMESCTTVFCLIRDIFRKAEQITKKAKKE